MKQSKSTMTVTKPATIPAPPLASAPVPTRPPAAPEPPLPDPPALADAATDPGATPGGEGVRPSAGGEGRDDQGLGPEENSQPMADAFRHGEAALARITGLHPLALAEARKNCAAEGEDWALVKNRVAYTEAGLRSVVTFLTGPIEDELIAGVALADVLEKTLLEELTPTTEPPVNGIVCAFYVNTQLIGVRLADTTIVNVRVASRVNFLRGMEVPLKKNADGKYELARKAPRTPGKW